MKTDRRKEEVHRTVRKHERHLKRLSIRWRNENLEFDGITRDICPEGVFIVSSHRVSPRTIVELEVQTRPDHFVRFHGQVAWINHGQVTHYPPGFGVRFIEFPEDLHDHLWIMCNECEEDEMDWEEPAGTHSKR